MIKRGLFYCDWDMSCWHIPEVWRGEIGNRFGVCAKHALEIGWIDKMPEPVQDAKPPQNRKGFLARLLESEGAALDELFPMPQPAPHWSDVRDFPF